MEIGTGFKRYGTIAGQAVFWIMLWARLLMCGVVFFWSSSAYPVGNEHHGLAISFAVLWLGWSVLTVAAATVGQPMQSVACRFTICVDALLSMIAIAVMKGEGGASIAFTICVIVFGLSARVGRLLLLLLALIWPIASVARDTAIFVFSIIPRQRETISLAPELSTVALQILALIAFVLWANRRYQLEKFSRDFSSMRMLSLEKSFDFDLQSWVDQFAFLFGPARAACIMAAPGANASSRYYQHGLDTWYDRNRRDELVSVISQMPDGCSLIDCDRNRIISPNNDSFRALDEMEQRLAAYVCRAGMSVALVQPMQIDRSKGGMICAIDRPIDAAKLAEANILGRHVTEMTEFLTRMARAERAFIADAHDVARRDLHDGVLQSLAALRMRLLILTKRKDVAATPIELEIRKTVDLLTLEQSRLRAILESSQNANNMVNLVAQLDICARSISLQWNIDLRLTSEDPAIPVDPESASNIEHLLREVIANAVRHAKSKSLTVLLSLKQDALMIAVTDLNPLSKCEQGIETPALTLKSASLRDRLRLVNGEAYAEGLGKGTLLSVRIPMQQVDDA